MSLPRALRACLRPANLAAFGAALVFALALGLGGMTLPERVLGFLNVAGAWDPTLLAFMAGAVVTYAAAYRLVVRRRAPLLGARFELPQERRIDAPLLVGAAIFGVGWGLAGFCPAPAIVSLAAGSLPALVFVAAMIAGVQLLAAQNALRERRGRMPAATPADHEPAMATPLTATAPRPSLSPHSSLAIASHRRPGRVRARHRQL